MRAFKVPFDINEEEKIVGGYLTLKQTGYMLLFGLLILLTILLPIGLNPVVIVLKIFLVLVLVVLGVMFMYYKPHGMPFAKYVSNYIKFRKRRKIVSYRR